MKRLLAVVVVFTMLAIGASALTAGCSGKVVPEGGVMLVFTSDGTLPQATSLHFDISVPDAAPFWSVDERIPAEITLPQTFAVDSNGNASAIAVVNANVRDENGNVLDDRVDQILQVPTERLAELRIVFSARCSTLAVTLPDGGAASKCAAGTTCDPDTSACVDNEIPASTLPTFVGDAGPPVTVGDATVPTDGSGGGGSGGEAGGGDDDAGNDAAGSGEGGGGGGDDMGNHFALLRKDGTSGGEYYAANLDYLALDGGLLQTIHVSAMLPAFSVERDTHKSLAVGADGTVYIPGVSLAPGVTTGADLGAVAMVSRTGQVTLASFGGQAVAPATGAAPLGGTNVVWASGNGLQLCSGSTCTTLLGPQSTVQMSLLEGALYINDFRDGNHLEQLFPDGGVSPPLFAATTLTAFALLDVMDAGVPDLAYIPDVSNIERGSFADGGFTVSEAPIPGTAEPPIGTVAFLAAVQIDAEDVEILATPTGGQKAVLCFDSFVGIPPTCRTVGLASASQLLEGVVWVPASP